MPVSPTPVSTQDYSPVIHRRILIAPVIVTTILALIAGLVALSHGSLHLGHFAQLPVLYRVAFPVLVLYSVANFSLFSNRFKKAHTNPAKQVESLIAVAGVTSVALFGVVTLVNFHDALFCLLTLPFLWATYFRFTVDIPR